MSRRPVLLPIVVLLLLAPAGLRAREGAALDSTEGRLVAAGPDGRSSTYP
jgi:hypothetical protein